MRVALLTWDFPPQPSGLGRAASEIAHGLVANGADVTVFTMDRDADTVSESTGLSVTGVGRGVSDLRGFRNLAAAGHLVAPSVFARAVRRAAEQEPFDIVEATNWYAPSLFLTGSRTPVVVRNSTPARECAASHLSVRDEVDLRFAHWLEARAVQQSDALISNAAHHAALIAAAYGVTTSSVHEVIPLSLSDERLEIGRRAAAPEAEGRRLLFIGRPERRKGFAELLQALEILNETEPKPKPVHLEVVGMSVEDVETSLATAGIGRDLLEHMTVHGRVSDEEQNRAFERSSFVVAPSRYESYGLVYREAAAFGRPLVACREDPSASDLIDAHPFGVLADRCEGTAIAESIRTLLADPGRCEQMRAVGLVHAQSLRRDELGARTLEVYRQAIKQRSGRLAA